MLPLYTPCIFNKLLEVPILKINGSSILVHFGSLEVLLPVIVPPLLFNLPVLFNLPPILIVA